MIRENFCIQKSVNFRNKIDQMDILSDVKIFGDLTFSNSYRVNFETNNYPEFHTNADYFYFVNCRG